MANHKTQKFVVGLAVDILPTIRHITKMEEFALRGLEIIKRRYSSLSPDKVTMVFASFVAENGKKNGCTSVAQILESIGKDWPNLCDDPTKCMDDVVFCTIVAKAWDIARKRGNGKK